MKKLGFIGLLALLQWSLAAQSSVNGIVFESSSCSGEGIKTPVPGATISADGAGQTKSRQDGTFTLNFAKTPPNASVAIVISMPGYAQKNNTAKTCRQCGGTPDIFILCSKSKLNASSLPEVGQKYMQDKTRLAQAEARLAQSQKDSEAYRKLLTEKEQIKKDLEANKEELKRLSADKDWKDISAELQEMLSDADVVNHKVKQRHVFDEESLQSFLELLYDSTATGGTDAPDAAGKPDKQRQIGELEWKAVFYTADYQFDKSEQCYRKLLELDGGNLNYLYSYAEMLNLQNKTGEAIAQLEKALNTKTGDPLLQVKLANYLARLYLQTNQPEKAKPVLNDAFALYKSISTDTSRYVDKQLMEAKLHDVYGALYFAENHFDNALLEFQTTLHIYERLNTLQNGEYQAEIADSQSKLASVHSSIKNYYESLKLYKQSLAIYEELSKDGNDLYFLLKCEVALNIANLNYIRNDFKESEELYNKLDNIFQNLAIDNPGRFDEYIAMIRVAEGKMLHDQKGYYLAESNFGKALDIYNQLNENGSGKFNASVASTLNARGKSMFAQKKYVPCKKDYDAALRINYGLAQRAPEIYEPSLAESYNLLGSYFLEMDKSDSAYYYYDKALKISQKFDAKDRRAYRLHLVQNKQSIASYYFRQGQNEVAKKEMDEAYRMAQELVKIDSAVFLPEYAMTVLTHGMVYMNEKESEVAIKKFKEAYDIFQRLSKDEPDVYELQKATIQWGLGTLYALENEDNQALGYFEQAINICEKQLQKNTNAYAPILAQVNLAKARISKKNENYTNALKFLETAEQWFVRLLSSNDLVEYRNHIGNIKIQMAQIYSIKKDYQRAENVANEARQCFSDLILKDPENENAYLANMAIIEEESAKMNRARGRKHEALDNYRRAEQYYKKLRAVTPPLYFVEECDTKLSIGETQQSLGQEQIAQQEFKSVIDTINRALQNNPGYEPDFLPTLARAHDKLGSLNFSKAQPDALKYYAKAGELYKKAANAKGKNYKYEIAMTYINAGSIYFNLNNFNNTVVYLGQALDHVKDNPNSPQNLQVTIGANHILGDLHFRAGKESYEEARQYYAKCLEQEQKWGDYLGPLEMLQLKAHAGITYLRSPEGNNSDTGEKILQDAHQYGIQYNWPADERQKVSEILQEICNNIDCK